MSYSEFKLSEVVQNFGLTIDEKSGMFAHFSEEECSDLLATILKENIDLAVAINTEKARSEMIISPILLEIRRKFNGEISLFSGVDFNVDNQKGLNGFCDFILSLSKEQLFVRAPVITPDFSRDVGKGDWFASKSGELQIETTVPSCCKVQRDEL